MSATPQQQPLAPIWQQRFAFYDTYGQPAGSKEGQAALRALPFGVRMRMNTNFLAFLLGPIYFFVKGMWRKGLVLLAIGLALMAVSTLVEVPEFVDRMLALVVPSLSMVTANFAYYLHAVKGSQSWNPVEGFGKAG